MLLQGGGCTAVWKHCETPEPIKEEKKFKTWWAWCQLTWPSVAAAHTRTHARYSMDWSEWHVPLWKACGEHPRHPHHFSSRDSELWRYTLTESRRFAPYRCLLCCHLQHLRKHRENLYQTLIGRMCRLTSAFLFYHFYRQLFTLWRRRPTTRLSCLISEVYLDWNPKHHADILNWKCHWWDLKENSSFGLLTSKTKTIIIIKIWKDIITFYDPSHHQEYCTTFMTHWVKCGIWFAFENMILCSSTVFSLKASDNWHSMAPLYSLWVWYLLLWNYRSYYGCYCDLFVFWSIW